MSNAYITNDKPKRPLVEQAFWVVLVLFAITLIGAAILAVTVGHATEHAKDLENQNKALTSQLRACETASSAYKQAVSDETSITSQWLQDLSVGNYYDIDLSPVQADIAKAKAAGCTTDTNTQS